MLAASPVPSPEFGFLELLEQHRNDFFLDRDRILLGPELTVVPGDGAADRFLDAGIAEVAKFDGGIENARDDGAKFVQAMQRVVAKRQQQVEWKIAAGYELGDRDLDGGHL